MSSKTQQHPEVWNWRTFILREGPENATYRHVLLTLSCYMNSAGESCYPSYDRLEEATCLSRTTLSKYLKKAVEDGWIEKDLHGYKGKKWKRNEYRARVPDDVLKAVSEVNHQNEGSSPDREGSSPDGEKAVNLSNATSPYNSPNNSTNSSSGSAGAQARESEEDWSFLDESDTPFLPDIKDAYQEVKKGHVDLPMMARRHIGRRGRSIPTRTIKKHVDEHGRKRTVAAYVLAGIQADSNPAKYAHSILTGNFRRNERQGTGDDSDGDRWNEQLISNPRGEG